MKPAAVMLVLLLSASAHAQDTDVPAAEEGDRSDAEARALFEAGEIAFSDGRFQDALDRFVESYSLSGHAELLFNIGSAADRLREDSTALQAFRQYLDEAPEAENREYVEERIRILDESTAQDASTAPSPGAGPWVLVATGGVLTIVGGVLLGVAIADRNAVENATSGPWSDFESRAARVGPMSGIGITSLGVGVALALAGVVWKVRASPGDDESSVQVDIGGSGLTLRGTF